MQQCDLLGLNSPEKCKIEPTTFLKKMNKIGSANIVNATHTSRNSGKRVL